MKHCNTCILPENYPGLSFDSSGNCSFCTEWKPRQYLGHDKLKELIVSNKGNSEYDCAISFSGGRDSTYLLFYLVKMLKLKVLALTIDNGYMSQSAKSNVKKITDYLNVESVIKPMKCLTKCFPRSLKSWSKNSDPAMIAALCTGCKYSVIRGRDILMKEYNCHVCISGANPFEPNPYKLRLVSINPASRSPLAVLAGGGFHMMKNVSWIMNTYMPYYLFRDFTYHIMRKRDRMGYMYLRPFYHFIRWEEKLIEEVLFTELHWLKSDSSDSSWRSDCNIAMLKQYLYKHFLGFNDQDGFLSALIRDGQISRDDALFRIKSAKSVDDDFAINIFRSQGLKLNLHGLHY